MAVWSMVDLDRRPNWAVEEAGGLLQRDAAVWRRLPSNDSKLALGVSQKAGGASGNAGHPRADADDPPARLIESELGIVTGDAVDFALGRPGVFRHDLQRGEGQVTKLSLSPLQRRQE